MSCILSFCIFTAAASVGARMPYESTEEHDFLDGVLAATILHSMNRLSHSTRCVHQRLELGFLNFLQQFRKIYIGMFV
jgi:exportin-7